MKNNSLIKEVLLDILVFLILVFIVGVLCYAGHI